MIRRLLNLLTALSLLLCVAACVLWARSYRRTDRVVWGRGEALILWRSVDGKVMFGRIMLPRWGWDQREGFHAGSVPGTDSLQSWLGWPQPTVWNRVGFGLIFDGSGRREAPWDQRILMIPHWAAALGAGALPALRFGGAIRRQRRGHRGLCPSCGYSLAGNVSGVCPECGNSRRESRKAVISSPRCPGRYLRYRPLDAYAASGYGPASRC